jgi:hypothetical protein
MRARWLREWGAFIHEGILLKGVRRLPTFRAVEGQLRRFVLPPVVPHCCGTPQQCSVAPSETLYTDDIGAYFLSREDLEKDTPLLFQLR